MSLFEAYVWTVVGVLISFVLPPLLKAAGITPKKDDATASLPSFWPKLKAFMTSRYGLVTALSLILALVLVAILQDELDTWNMALISGLGWQSIFARTFSPGD